MLGKVNLLLNYFLLIFEKGVEKRVNFIKELKSIEVMGITQIFYEGIWD